MYRVLHHRRDSHPDSDLTRLTKRMSEACTLIYFSDFSRSMFLPMYPSTHDIEEPHLRIRRKRPSLRVIVSSATLDATSFLDYFTAGNSSDEATIVSLEGRMYPVEVAYTQEPTPDYVRKAAETVWNIHMQVSRSCTCATMVCPLTLRLTAKPRRCATSSTCTLCGRSNRYWHRSE